MRSYKRSRYLCTRSYKGLGGFVRGRAEGKGPGTFGRGRAKFQVDLYEVVQRSRWLCTRSYEGLRRCRCTMRTKVQVPLHGVVQRPRYLCTRSYEGLGGFVRSRGCLKAQ
eukprot:1616367-Alexandrium_andersonii.AAC.1